jgi:L-iditol 2-dehydrogenase
MKAALYRGGDRYEYEEVRDPVCPEDGLLIKVEACTICGTDLKILKAQDVKIEGGKQRRMKLPRITGHELSGSVVQTGRKVRGFVEGDRVTVAVTVPCGFCRYCQAGNQEMCDNVQIIGYDKDGGFAEYIGIGMQEIAAACINKIPPGVSFDAASLTEPLSCVVNCLEITPIKMGDVAVVFGAGPMGCFFVNIARKRCAGKIFLVEISDSRLQIARDLLEEIGTPPDAYINSKSENLVPRVLAETGGRGADLVITACPSPEAQSQSLELIAKRGRINFFGGLPRANSVVALDTNLIHYKECLVTGTHGSAPRHNRAALDLIAANVVPAERYITHRFDLSQIMEGIEVARSGDGVKVLIRP